MMFKGLLITTEYPPQKGGVATYYESIVRSNRDTLEVLPLAQNPRRLSWLSYFAPIVKRIIQTRPAMLYVGQILPLGYIAVLFKYSIGMEYSVFVHGMDVFHSRLNPWKRWWIRVILLRARQVIVNSAYVKNRLGEEYCIPAQKIVICHPRIDVAEIEKQAESIPPARKNTSKVIVSMGRLVKRKGFDMVLKALPFVKVPDYEYWIIGEGPDRMRLENIVKETNLVNKVKFLSAVPAPQVYGLLKACDVFIMPSREIQGDIEGFGIVFLEAGVFKKPVIGGRSGGVPEAIEDGVTGLLVDPEDPREIASALQKLLTNPQLAITLGQAGYDRVKNKNKKCWFK